MKAELNIEESLKGVMNSLLDITSEEAREREPYQDMLKAAKGKNFKRVLRELENRMSLLTHDAMQAMEDAGVVFKDVKSADEVWLLFCALPYLSFKLEKHFCKTEGSVCSVDKVFHILNKYITERV